MKGDEGVEASEEVTDYPLLIDCGYMNFKLEDILIVKPLDSAAFEC